MSENKPATITEVLADLDNERQGHVDNGYHEGITYAMSLLEDLPRDLAHSLEQRRGLVREVEAAERQARGLQADYDDLLDRTTELDQALAAEKAGHTTTLESLQTMQARGTRLAELAERHANHAADAVRQRDQVQAALDMARIRNREVEAERDVARQQLDPEQAVTVAALHDQLATERIAYAADRAAWAATEAGLHERLDVLQVDGHTDRCAAALRTAIDEREDARKAAREGDQHLANLADAEKRAESLAKQVETLQTAMRRTLAHIGRADALLTDYVAPAGDGDQVDELERGPLLGYAINPDGSTGEPVYAAVEIRP